MKDDSIFDSTHMLDSQIKEGSQNKKDNSKPPLQLKHLVDISNQKMILFQPSNLEKDFAVISHGENKVNL